MHFSKVLVLGAGGRLGGILRKAWPKGHARWHNRTTPPARHPDWVHLDLLRDSDALTRAMAGCDRVICLAGVTDQAAARGADMGDNVTLALATIRAAARADADHRAAGQGVQVLLASSAAVYGRQSGVLTEDGPAQPISPYGRAKLEMEHAGTRLGAQLGVDVTALRIGNVAGVDAILGGWRPGFVLDRFADGRTPRRSYIGAQTLARVLYALPRDLPPVLNIAAPGLVEMGALLDAGRLGWTPRAAPDQAIAQVHLSTARLETLVPFTAADSDPAQMVAQWRRMTETRDHNPNPESDAP